MPKKPITTADLARLIATGFDEVKAELSDAEERIRSDMATKADVATEIRGLRTEVEASFKEVKGTLAELRASSRVLDTLLEKYLVERLDRIEKFLKLPPYVRHDTEQAA